MARPGADLAQASPGGAHRIGPEPVVERGTIIELHARDEDEVRLPAERLGDAVDAGGPQAGSGRDEGQVLVAVAPLECLERLRAAVRPAIEREQHRHRAPPCWAGGAARRRATASVDR